MPPLGAFELSELWPPLLEHELKFTLKSFLLVLFGRWGALLKFSKQQKEQLYVSGFQVPRLLAMIVFFIGSKDFDRF